MRGLTVYGQLGLYCENGKSIGFIAQDYHEVTIVLMEHLKIIDTNLTYI